jgi:hypothetical protein
MSSKSFQNASKLNGIVSVLQFGAVGDGVADDTAAIQAAVNAAGLFGTVQFPAGVYKTTATITVPPISGGVAAIVFTSTGTATIRPAANLAAVFTVTGNQCVFENLNIDAGSSTTTAGIKITVPYLNAAMAARINRCTISGFQNALELSGPNYNITDCFFLNGTTSIYFIDDGRNSSISRNYFLGSSVGIRLGKILTQCEGARIIDNCILCTGTNGAAIYIDAALECYIIGNIIDQNGNGTPGIYCNPIPTNSVNRLKIVSNWIAGGQNSYSCFFNSQTSSISLSLNTIVETNGLPVIAGISCNNVNAIGLINNNSLIGNPSSGNDFVAVNCVNVSQFGNESTRGQVNFLNNLTHADFTSSTGIYSPKGTFGGQSITGGGAAPTAVENAGSIYMRTPGSLGNRLYVSQGGGSWLPVAGV